MGLAELLGAGRGVTSVIGSGGKTSLLAALARELSSTVVLTTTTHILPFAGVPLVTSDDAGDVVAALAGSRIVCVGSQAEKDGKLTAPELGMDVLAALADHVLVEADGSRRLPLKAHAHRTDDIFTAIRSSCSAPPGSVAPCARSSTARSASASSPGAHRTTSPRPSSWRVPPTRRPWQTSPSSTRPTSLPTPPANSPPNSACPPSAGACATAMISRRTFLSLTGACATAPFSHDRPAPLGPLQPNCNRTLRDRCCRQPGGDATVGS